MCGVCVCMYPGLESSLSARSRQPGIPGNKSIMAHTHTLINPQRHAQPDGLNAVSGTPSQRDSSGKVSKNNLIRHKLSLDRVS